MWPWRRTSGVPNLCNFRERWIVFGETEVLLSSPRRLDRQYLLTEVCKPRHIFIVVYFVIVVHSHWKRSRQIPRTSTQNQMGTCVVIGLCAVWTPPHNPIQPIFLCLGIGQCKLTILRSLRCDANTEFNPSLHDITFHHFFETIKEINPLYNILHFHGLSTVVATLDDRLWDF